MSFLGTHDDAIKYANKAVHVIDGEDSTSPVRDGGSDTGGASWSHGVAEFDNHEQHGVPIKAQGHNGVRRSYGLDSASTPK